MLWILLERVVVLFLAAWFVVRGVKIALSSAGLIFRRQPDQCSSNHKAVIYVDSSVRATDRPTMQVTFVAEMDRNYRTSECGRLPHPNPLHADTSSRRDNSYRVSFVQQARRQLKQSVLASNYRRTMTVAVYELLYRQLYIHCESKKLCPYYFYCNFGKCWPILIILSVS